MSYGIELSDTETLIRRLKQELERSTTLADDPLASPAMAVYMLHNLAHQISCLALGDRATLRDSLIKLAARSAQWAEALDH